MSARSIPVLVVLTTLLAAIPAGAQVGDSLGVTPPTHDIQAAQPGQQYVREVTVQNEFDTESTVTLELSGELANWTTTSPADEFLVPPRTHSPIELTISVPEDAVNGTYLGKLHLTAEPKDQPDGSGAAIRYSVAVLIELQVGGEPVRDVQFGTGGASDVEEGSPPEVSTSVTNQGNVRDTAEACAVVLPLNGEEPVAQVREEIELLPGETGTLSFSFDDPLPRGEYEIRILPHCDEAQQLTLTPERSTFKVVPPGELGKDGVLRFLEHPTTTVVDRPIKIIGVFENIGEAGIARAKATAEVYKDGELVAVLETDPLVVRPGERVDLAAFFTPSEPGEYTVVGTVTYDGFQTEERESSFVVQGEATGAASLPDLATRWSPLVGLLAAGILIAFWLQRRSRPDEAPEGPQTETELEVADVEPLEPGSGGPGRQP